MPIQWSLVDLYLSCKMQKKSPKLGVQFMPQKVLRNASTTTGRNISMIENIIGPRRNILEVSPKWVKNNVSFSNVSEHDKWRVSLIKEIVDLKCNILEFSHVDDSFLTKEELDDIVCFVSTT